MVSTGGTYLREDIMRLYNAVHILVGTPGRILDLAHKNVVKLSHCTMVVMDEADKKVSLFPHLASLFHLWSCDAHLDVLRVIAVGNQSSYNILQICHTRGTPGKAIDRTRRFMLLHSCQNAASSPESRLP